MTTSGTEPLIGSTFTDSTTVYVIDDDADDRVAASRLAVAAGLKVRQFSAGQELLDQLPRLEPGIFIVDVMMPDVDGRMVLKAVMQREAEDVVIMMSSQTDVAIAVGTMRDGAHDFILKPLKETETRATLARAVQVVRDARSAAEQKAALQKTLTTVTPKEMRVLRKLIAGKRNKMVAHELGVSERTVEVHRARLINRVEAGTFAGLIAFAVRAGVEPDDS